MDPEVSTCAPGLGLTEGGTTCWTPWLMALGDPGGGDLGAKIKRERERESQPVIPT